MSTINTTAEELRVIERKAKWFWVSMIVGLLATQVVIGFVSVYVAIGDPSVAIIPNYHQKALDWDISHRAHEHVRSLGWDIRAVITPNAANEDQRDVQIRIVDPQHSPVTGLRVEASIYHLARGTEIEKVVMKETEPGTYAAVTSLHRKGLWRLDLQLEGSEGLGAETIEIAVD